MSDSIERTRLARREATRAGMALAFHAREAGGRPAVMSPCGDRSFDELNARANQLARALRARGLGAGDAIAFVCANRPEFAEIVYAALRAGLRFTPVNWHLTASEIAYIVNDCGARAFIGDARFADALAPAAALAPDATARLAVGGAIDGFDSYEAALSAQPCDDLADPVLGGPMLYTSGTTGKPKGVSRKPGPPARGAALVGRLAGYQPGTDMNLCTGPLYHAAPLAFSLTGPLNAGVGVVMMDGWGAQETLELIERHRITHSHMVPTMFHRLLSLPEDVRARHDLSSLRMVLHGAAPCPVPVKKALIDWFGPVVYEYYAATEGWGSFVTPATWLSKPGTVGKPEPGDVEIRDEKMKAQAPGQVGQIYLRAPDLGRFVYHKDGEKTSRAYDAERAYFTLGDMGYVDQDGYLFLCDRSADVIISGGVNIYPAEVDAVLLTHPCVGDVAVVGVPNSEWGEEVRAVVELRPGIEPDEALASELVAYSRERLAHYKCPRKVDFVDALPRHETGKIYRRFVRERYWTDHRVKI
jgi:long-chain acyl-CoA synthetase